MDPEIKGPEYEDTNTDPGNGGNDHRGSGVEDSSIGVPRGVEPGLRGNPQPQPVRREYLFKRFCKMKPPSFP